MVVFSRAANARRGNRGDGNAFSENADELFDGGSFGQTEVLPPAEELLNQEIGKKLQINRRVGGRGIDTGA